ncbi:hypothetical protein IVA88_16700 [Bradyrhizobium sp. 149]|uniref:hypothetical protein n=1 Tax=Bradyrhizobium sp. 149 TaxID=2782624 RepID=UPI001FFA6FD2|nr:hypothetical protein [Bradyrhizobium sp. 149]MCK1653059.1 hypothetical protein [Bradyrhizobium sp. 149]
MTEFNNIEAPKPAVTYWKYEEPTAAYPPGYYQNIGEEYRNFIIMREGEHLLYTIKTKENGKPPIPLRSSFTNKVKAMECIDKFLEQEASNRAAAENKEKNEN